MEFQDKLDLYELNTMVLICVSDIDMLRLSYPEDMEVLLFDQVARIVEVANRMDDIIKDFEDKDFHREVNNIRTDAKQALFSSTYHIPQLKDSVESFFMLLYRTI